MIHQHRAEIEVHIAVLDLPAPEIRHIADRMIAEKQPKWNVLEPHRRR